MVAESVGVNMGACISDCISWCVGAKVKEQGYVLNFSGYSKLCIMVLFFISIFKLKLHFPGFECVSICVHL